MTTAQLPRRSSDPAKGRPPAPEVSFHQPLMRDEMPLREPAADMGTLADRIRSMMALQRGAEAVLPLGGYLFDAVITASGHAASGVIAMMDEVQRAAGDSPDACGPVIEDPQRSWLIWLVPPGTSERWMPHRYAMCLGRPHRLALPPLGQMEPPGVFWRRRLRGDRLAPPEPLRDYLDRFQPGPAPHEAILASVLCTIS